MLFKLLSYQDKRLIMSQKRLKLIEAPFYMTEDLTKQDRDQKRKWSTEVAQAFQAGNFLHFSAGKWRTRHGLLLAYFYCN